MKFAPRQFALGLLALASACAQEAPEAFRPLPLARGGVPTGWIAGKPIVSVLEAPEGWLRIPEVIPPSAWRPAAWPGIYQASVRLPGIGSPPGRPGPHELRVGERELTGQPFSQNLLEPEKFADGDFASFGDELFLVDRSGELVRGPLQYIAWIERGFRDEGRVHIPGITCDGVLLLPGERLRLDLPSLGDGGAELVFGVAAFGSQKSGNDEPPELVLRVESGGQTLHTESLAVELLCSAKPVRIALPKFEGGELTIVIEGELALALIQNPVLSPLVDSIAAVDVRPDLVLFLADTFRADNLAQWGGDPGLAPIMNAFGESGLVLTDAHAPASWTLPSQASLLSGVYSPQIGLVGSNHAIPSQFHTLARALSEAGYRTAAV
ncbi:MAG: sulfatase-like hydrolase/transferase, partial [Planctomycetota bacterium]|nr:sulfatase-like hydrolase/transferase [Planctomycetota bacterium]